MITITDRESCTGCTACKAVCPKRCIEMKADREGFLYPEVDLKSCVDCHLCEQVCPVLQPYDEHRPDRTLAMVNSDETVRRQSSSGGVFSLLAEMTLREGGVVAGAAFDEQWGVHHIVIDCLADLPKLRGSKYVQSRMEDVYNKVCAHLHRNQKVLFSGTPCQVAGLKHLVGRKHIDDSNLLCVDVVCHGVPSPKIWQWYLTECFRRKGGVSKVIFRDKCGGWYNYHTTIGDSHSVHHNDDRYMQLFLNNLCLRPSCHQCPAKFGRSQSDITLADFWNVEKVTDGYADDRGTSLVMVNTQRGADAVSGLDGKEVSFDDAIQYNPSWHTAAVPHPHRRRFFKYYRRHPKDFELFLSNPPVTLIDKLVSIIR